MFYSVLFAALFGGTPGKMIVGIRIVSAEDGGDISFFSALMRYAVPLLYYIIVFLIVLPPEYKFALGNIVTFIPSMHYKSVLVFILSIYSIVDIIVFFCSGKHRALHDIIAGTAVVKT